MPKALPQTQDTETSTTAADDDITGVLCCFEDLGLSLDTAVKASHSFRGRLQLQALDIIPSLAAKLHHLIDTKSQLLTNEAQDAVVKLFQLVEALCQDRDCAIHLGFLGGHRSLTSFVEWTQRNEDVNEEISDSAAAAVGQIMKVLPPTRGFGFPMSRRFDGDKSNLPSLITFTYMESEKQRHLKVALRSEKHIRMQSQDDVGQILWPGAIALAKWLIQNREILLGKNVLEIGAGMGLVGIVAGHFSPFVSTTDFMPEVNKNLLYNVNLNVEKDGEIEGFNDDKLQQILPTPIPPLHVVKAQFLDWSDKSIGAKDSVKELRCSRLDSLPKWTEVSAKTDSPESFGSAKGNDTFTSEKSEEGGEDHHSGVPSLERTLRFDVIIGSDMVCSPADVAGVARVLHQWMSYPSGKAFLVLPPGNVRWGVQFLRPILTEIGFNVHHLNMETQEDVTLTTDAAIEDTISSGVYYNELQLWVISWIENS